MENPGRGDRWDTGLFCMRLTNGNGGRELTGAGYQKLRKTHNLVQPVYTDVYIITDIYKVDQAGCVLFSIHSELN